jgi:sulfur-oxidizing protein SoxB
MTLRGEAIGAEKTYRVAGWAPVSEDARQAGGEPIWDLVARHLRARKTIPAPRLNVPTLAGIDGNPGIAP